MGVGVGVAVGGSANTSKPVEACEFGFVASASFVFVQQLSSSLGAWSPAEFVCCDFVLLSTAAHFVLFLCFVYIFFSIF